MELRQKAPLKKPHFFKRILYSVFPSMQRSTEDRGGSRRFFRSLILHFRPRTVPERTLRLTLTWGLGGMAAVLVLLLMGTGMLLKFFYEPFPGKAYESILYLQGNVLFGQFIRNIHHWSGNGLLIVVFLHFLRVFFTGAFHPPRQFNWIIGLFLFFAVLSSNFTGYLMPWDQLAFWACTISTGMLEYLPFWGEWLQKLIQGGSEIGPATLSNFYTIHTAILPVIIIIFMSFHFWRIRKAGGLVILRAPEEDATVEIKVVDTIPNLIIREVVVALVLLASILVFSIIFDAPLESKANPGLSPNPTKAPWFLVGIQEMLIHFHPLFSLFLIPLLVLIALLALPYFDFQAKTAGVWFASSKGRKIGRIAALAAIFFTPLGVLADEYILDFAAWMNDIPVFVTNGVIPFVLVLAGSAGFYIMTKRRYSANNNEAVQGLFILFLVAFLVLTVIGIWFRGSGMELAWAWV